MNIEQLKPGTKLNYYHDNGTPSPSLCLAEVIQVSPTQVKVRDEQGDEAWKDPSFFNAIVSEETYRQIMDESCKPVMVKLTLSMARDIARGEGTAHSEGMDGPGDELLRIVRDNFPQVVKEYSYLPWGSY